MFRSARIGWAGFCLFAIVGCGGHATGTAPVTASPSNASPSSTPQPILTAGALSTAQADATPFATTTVATGHTSTPSPSATPRPRATATSAPSAPPQVTEALLTPGTVASGSTLHAAVTVTGAVSRIVVYLSAGPAGAGPFSYTLTQSTAGAWSATITAPVAGDYHYTVGIFDSAGRRTIVDNDAWNIHVTGGAAGPTPGGAAPAFPDNIPLAPPFSYGNPVAAVFSAAGKTVNGAEVVSNSRPDVSAATVAQYYSVHFPRAGWTVTAPASPSAGATSFSMVATQGAQACVVNFAAGTVTIYYGTFGG